MRPNDPTAPAMFGRVRMNVVRGRWRRLRMKIEENAFVTPRVSLFANAMLAKVANVRTGLNASAQDASYIGEYGSVQWQGR